MPAPVRFGGALLLLLVGGRLSAQGDPVAYFKLGNSLMAQDRRQEAITAYRQAIAIQPDPVAYFNLGQALRAEGRLEEAAEAYRQASQLQPDYLDAQNNYAGILSLQGRLDDAVAVCQRIITRHPTYARARVMLGTVLSRQGKSDEAVAAFRQAVALQPDDPVTHYNLSCELIQSGKAEEGVAACRRAIALKPDYADAYLNLGSGLRRQGKLDEAIAAYRQVTARRPDDPLAHRALGIALAQQQRPEEASDAFRREVALRPDDPQGHCNLGYALQQSGALAEALKAFRRGHELATARPGCSLQTAPFIAQTERLIQQEALLPAVLAGKTPIAPARDWMEYARLCKATKRYSAAAGLYARAFAADPELAGELKSAHRFFAACSAALAGCGQGTDPTPDEQQRATWRRQAREWLKADLELCLQQAGSGAPAGPPTPQQMLSHWQQSGDLRGLRDPGALAQQPAEEQQAWKQFWADVEKLLQKEPPCPKR